MSERRRSPDNVLKLPLPPTSVDGGAPPRRAEVPLYLQLAQELKQQILIGVFKPNQKLPSVRVLARTKHLSINTVQEAYRLLEDDQWIVVRAQSGTYVALQPPMASESPANSSPTISVRQVAPASELAYRDDLLPLGAAVPDACFFPCKRFATSIASLLRATPALIGRYNFAPGGLSLRQQIARRVVEWGAHVDPQRVVVTNGAVEAVQLCLRAVAQPGDTVVVEDPAYYGFLQLLQSLSLRALPVPVSQQCGMDLDRLEQALAGGRVAAILLSTTVSNPSGFTIPLPGKRRLVALAEQHAVPVIEDATFADLHFEGECQAAQGFATNGQTMLCASLTKTVAPGMRIGWVDGGRYSEQINYLKRISSIGQPEVMELALADYLSTGGMAKHLRQIRRVMREQVYRMAESVERIFPKGTRFNLPSGGFLLWVQLPEDVDSMALQIQAAKVGVSVAPGALFSAQGGYRNCIRLNCGVADVDRVRHGLQTLSGLIRPRGSPLA